MNIFQDLDFTADTELITELCNKPEADFRVERILSCGQTSEVYEQAEDEFVILLDGEARLMLFNEETKPKEIMLSKGDQLWIPAHQRHQVTYTSKHCVWLCIFLKPRR